MTHVNLGQTLTTVYTDAELFEQEVDVCSRLLLTSFTQQDQNITTRLQKLANVTELLAHASIIRVRGKTTTSEPQVLSIWLTDSAEPKLGFETETRRKYHPDCFVGRRRADVKQKIDDLVSFTGKRYVSR